MDNRERQEKENRAFDEMRNEGRNIRRNRQEDNDIQPSRTNRLWVWLGVLVLIFILLYWLFAIGTFGDLANWFNG
ncbi:MAG: hypothetical protein K2L00_10420 [Muribaculaceae bacterium]|nr:hypothetical protein [Muribaculaceae bacterium]